MRRFLTLPTVVAAVVILPLAVQAAQPDELDPLYDYDELADVDPIEGFDDPLEGLNRKVLAFNEEIDAWILDPITRAYRFLTPEPLKDGLRNALSNLNSPVVLANDVLQAEFHDAGISLWRFVVNSTVGLAGLIDVGSHLGVEGHVSDFDQTLAIYGIPSGPFLIIPVAGPSTARGIVGLIVDLAFRPTAYVLGPADQLTWTIIQGGSSGLATREAAFDDLRALQDAAVDYYAALRNAYYQSRMAEIWRRRPECRPD